MPIRVNMPALMRLFFGRHSWLPLMTGHPFWEATFDQHLGWLLVRGFTVLVRWHHCSESGSRTLEVAQLEAFTRQDGNTRSWMTSQPCDLIWSWVPSHRGSRSPSHSPLSAARPDAPSSLHQTCGHGWTAATEIKETAQSGVINSLAPSRFEWIFIWVIFKLIWSLIINDG